MEIYSVGEDDLRRIPDGDIEYEENLEEHLLKSRGAEIGGVKMIYLSRQGTPDKGGIFDILGVDENGDTVVVELKRGKAPRRIIAQALEYASGIRKEAYDQLNDRYKDFLRDTGQTVEGEPSFREAHAEFFNREEDPLSDQEFNSKQRLVVVGTEFRDVTLNMADLLREHDMDVVCVKYQAFESEDDDLKLLTTQSVRRPLSEEPDTGDDSPTETQKIELEFWNELEDRISQRSSTPLYTGEAEGKNYYSQPRNLPSSGHYALVVNTRKGYLQVKLHIDENETFEYLHEHKDKIESELDNELQWNHGDGGRATIILQRDGNIKTDREQWDKYQKWLIENAEAFDEVFRTYLRDT